MSGPQTFEDWRDQAEARLMADYCINLDDAGLDDELLRREFAQTPDATDFIAYFAQKFDLTSRHDVRQPTP